MDGRTVRRLLDCELREVSTVSSNPDAIVKHKSLGLVPASYMPDASGDLARAAAGAAGFELPLLDTRSASDEPRRPAPVQDASAELASLATRRAAGDDDTRSSIDHLFPGPDAA